MIRSVRSWSLTFFCLLVAAVAFAGGGPRNVLVVVNERAPESLEIGNYYVRQRGIPAANICRIQTGTALTATKAVYQDEIETPVEACIAASPYAGRIDYIVLTRGLPIRASFPGGRVSTTALLQAMDTALRGKDQEFNPPGFINYPSAWVRAGEYFSHANARGGRNLYMATMLTGYWSSDAMDLVDRSLASDLNPPTDNGGIFFLEEARAPANRRNSQLGGAATAIQNRGHQVQIILESDPDVTASIVASHLNGGVYSAISEAEIRSNTYPPGCLVDALESYGLVPNNLTPGATRSQVPITWWITAGVTGAHGTVSEPYDVAFPDADLFTPYLDGYNLGETFVQGIPYLYWMNLVLGDPLLAPYATPPLVTIASPVNLATVSRNVTIDASAVTSSPGGIQKLEFFVDDTLVDTVLAGAAQTTWDSRTVSDGLHTIDVIAYEDTAVYSQATASHQVLVDNDGLLLTIDDPPPLARVTGSFMATVSALGSITDVTIFAEGLRVGSASGGSPFTINVSTVLLGNGFHTLIAEGTGTGIAVRSEGLEIEVVKAPIMNSITPNRGPDIGGTTVAIDGWYMSPSVRVYFDGNEAASVTWLDAHHIEVVTPPGTIGPVDLRFDDQLGLTTTVTAGYTYGCAVTTPVDSLHVAVEADGRLRFVWADLVDPCLDTYRVFESTDPTPPPAFPGGFSDVTASDEDGDIGGDASFLYTFSGTGTLTWFQVAGSGSDGSLGPN